MTDSISMHIIETVHHLLKIVSSYSLVNATKIGDDVKKFTSFHEFIDNIVYSLVFPTWLLKHFLSESI